MTASRFTQPVEGLGNARNATSPLFDVGFLEGNEDELSREVFPARSGATLSRDLATHADLPHLGLRLRIPKGTQLDFETKHWPSLSLRGRVRAEIHDPERLAARLSLVSRPTDVEGVFDWSSLPLTGAGVTLTEDGLEIDVAGTRAILVLRDQGTSHTESPRSGEARETVAPEALNAQRVDLGISPGDYTRLRTTLARLIHQRVEEAASDLTGPRQPSEDADPQDVVLCADGSFYAHRPDTRSTVAGHVHDGCVTLHDASQLGARGGSLLAALRSEIERQREHLRLAIEPDLGSTMFKVLVAATQRETTTGWFALDMVLDLTAHRIAELPRKRWDPAIDAVGDLLTLAARERRLRRESSTGRFAISLSKGGVTLPPPTEDARRATLHAKERLEGRVRQGAFLGDAPRRLGATLPPRETIAVLEALRTTLARDRLAAVLPLSPESEQLRETLLRQRTPAGMAVHEHLERELEARLGTAPDAAIAARLDAFDRAHAPVRDLLSMAPEEAARALEDATVHLDTCHLVLGTGPGVLVTWTREDRLLGPDRLAVRQIPSREGLFLYPGCKVSWKDLVITVRTNGARGVRALELPGRGKEAIEPRIVVRELLSGSGIVSIESRNPALRMTAEVRGGTLRVLEGPSGSPLLDRVTRSLGEIDGVGPDVTRLIKKNVVGLLHAGMPLERFLESGRLDVILAAAGNAASPAAMERLSLPNLPFDVLLDRGALTLASKTFTTGLEARLAEFVAAFASLGEDFLRIEGDRLQVSLGGHVATLEIEAACIHAPPSEEATHGGARMPGELHVIPRLNGRARIPSSLLEILGSGPMTIDDDAAFMISATPGHDGTPRHRLTLSGRVRWKQEEESHPFLIVIPQESRTIRPWLVRGLIGATAPLLRDHIEHRLAAILGGTSVTVRLLRPALSRLSVDELLAKSAELESLSAQGDVDLEVHATVAVGSTSLRLLMRARVGLRDGRPNILSLEGETDGESLRRALEPLSDLQVVGTLAGLERHPITVRMAPDDELHLRLENIPGFPDALEIIVSHQGTLRLAPDATSALARALLARGDVVRARVQERIDRFVSGVFPAGTGLHAGAVTLGTEGLAFPLLMGDQPLGSCGVGIGLDGLSLPSDQDLWALAVMAPAPKVDELLAQVPAEIKILGVDFRCVPDTAREIDQGVAFSVSRPQGLGGDGGENLVIEDLLITPSGRLSFERAKIQGAESGHAFAAILQKNTAALGLPGIGIRLSDATLDVSRAGVSLSTDLWIERALCDHLRLGSLAGAPPHDGIRVGRAVITFRDDRFHVELEAGVGSVDAAIGAVLSAQARARSPLRIGDRLVFVDALRYAAERIEARVRVIEEGDIPLVLSGTMRIDARALPPVDFVLDAGPPAVAAVAAWLKKLVPSTSLLGVAIHEVDAAGRRVTFGVSSEILGMSFELHDIALEKGRVSFPGGSRVAYSSSLPVALGTSGFTLVKPEGELDLASRRGETTTTITASGLHAWVARLRGTLVRDPGHPNALTLHGALELLENFRVANTRARIDVGEGLFDAAVTLGRRDLVALTGRLTFRVPGWSQPWHCRGQVELQALDMDLARVGVRGDASGLAADARVEFLFVEAEASVRSDWWLDDPTVAIHCLIDVEIAQLDVAVEAHRFSYLVAVVASAGCGELRIRFHIPRWKALTKRHLARMIAKALTPSIHISGDPKNLFKNPRFPRFRLRPGELAINFDGGFGPGDGSPGEAASTDQPEARTEAHLEQSATAAEESADKASRASTDARATGETVLHHARAAVARVSSEPTRTATQESLANARRLAAAAARTASKAQDPAALEEAARRAHAAAEALRTALENADRMADALDRSTEALERVERELHARREAARAPLERVGISKLIEEAIATRERARTESADLRARIAAEEEPLRRAVRAKHDAGRAASAASDKEAEAQDKDIRQDDALALEDSEALAAEDLTDERHRSSRPTETPRDEARTREETERRQDIANARANTLALFAAPPPDLPPVKSGEMQENVLVMAAHVVARVLSTSRTQRADALDEFLRSETSKGFRDFVNTAITVARGQSPDGMTVPLLILRVGDSTATVYEHAFVLTALTEILRGLYVPGMEEPELGLSPLIQRLPEQGYPLAKGHALRSVVAGLLRALWVAQCAQGMPLEGSWGYADWAGNGLGGDMSVSRAALLALRTALDGSDRGFDTLLLREVFGPGDTLATLNDATSRLLGLFSRARRFAEACRSRDGKHTGKRPGQLGTSFMAGAALAHLPLIPTVTDGLSAQLALASPAVGPETLIALVLEDARQLSARIRISENDASADFDTHYRLLYALGALRAWHGAQKTAARMNDGLWSTYSALMTDLASRYAALPQLTPRYATARETAWVGNAGHRAMAMLVHASLLRELTWLTEAAEVRR